MTEPDPNQQPTLQNQRTQVEPMRKIWTEKMAKWAIFSVVMALVPIAAALLIQATHGKGLGWNELVGRGELLLITAALCARSSGELFTGTNAFQVEKIVAGGATMIVLLLTSLYFADVSAAVRSNANIDRSLVTLVSILTYGCAIVSGARCIYLSEATS